MQAQGQTLIHIQMQSGTFRNFVRHEGQGPSVDPVPEPWLMKACVLNETDSNHVLESFLRRVPILLELCERSTTIIISITLDRATTNFVTMSWLFNYCETQLPANILLHLEPCNIHGGMLVKGRSSHGKKAAMSCNSYSRLTRDWKANQAIREAITAQVTRENVRVEYTEITPEHKAWADRVVNALFPGGQNEKLIWTRTKNGQHRKKTPPDPAGSDPCYSGRARSPHQVFGSP